MRAHGKCFIYYVLLSSISFIKISFYKLYVGDDKNLHPWCLRNAEVFQWGVGNGARSWAQYSGRGAMKSTWAYNNEEDYYMNTIPKLNQSTLSIHEYIFLWSICFYLLRYVHRKVKESPTNYRVMGIKKINFIIWFWTGFFCH